MKRILSTIILILVFCTSVFSVPAEKTKPVFYVLHVDGIIDSAISDYVVKGIDLAEKNNAEGVIMVMQTPGGLDTSMRKIVGRMLTSNIPIITYISPKGSRAASAGTFILLASNIVAMAEGTNIGTAHPVDFSGKSLSEKITNDAIAYIKNLARMRGRNEKWAEEAITKNVSSSEIDALKDKVIDYIAKDMPDLMKQINKKEVKVNDKKIIINTENYELKDITPNVRYRFLHYITDPNISYVLFLVGIYGIIYELANPGAILPGVAGAIAIVLAFYGFGSLPINIAGLILILFAVILFIVDIKAPTHGILTAGGIASIVIGSILLFPSRAMGEQWAASYLLMGTMIAVTVAFFVLVIALVLKAHKKRVVSGVQSLIGAKGVAHTDITATDGMANIGGEDWQAFSDEEIKARDIVEVTEIQGMKAKVKKIPRKKEE